MKPANNTESPPPAETQTASVNEIDYRERPTSYQATARHTTGAKFRISLRRRCRSFALRRNRIPDFKFQISDLSSYGVRVRASWISQRSQIANRQSEAGISDRQSTISYRLSEIGNRQWRGINNQTSESGISNRQSAIDNWQWGNQHSWIAVGDL
jgi:hypothetical protein